MEKQKLLTYSIIKPHEEHIDEYIEDIKEIESARYLLKDVDVYREVFGTDDFNILYEFRLLEDRGIIVKLGNMPDNKIREIKSEEYGDEMSKKWDGDYEWMSEMK